MKKNKNTSTTKGKIVSLRRVGYLVALVVLASAPLLMWPKAEAAQLTSRSLTLSTAIFSATSVTYTYGFTTATTAAIQSIEFEACTTAVGSCSAPAGLTINAGTEASRSGWTNATTFARNATGGGGCTPAANVLCLDRTQAASETAGARTLGWNSQTNPSSTNTAFFVRITLYSDTGWTTTVDTGTVAAATVSALTVNANVAEILNFCIGRSTVNDATTSVGADCSALSGTSIHIGTLSSSFTNVSPVNTNGGDNFNAVAMIRTNAGSGAVVNYKAIQQSGSNQLGTLRISGASCSAADTDLTDRCIRAQGTTQGTFTPAGNFERFGMTVAAINCGSTVAYTCTFSSGTYNLTRDAAYDGDGGNTYPTDSGEVAGTTDAGYAWDQAGTADQIASSTTVIDDETMILKFAATAAITTPFGAYAAQADFIATPTY